MVFKGSTSGDATSTAARIAAVLKSFSIANKAGGSITVKVGIVYGSTITYILYNYSLATAISYIYTGEPITIEANYQIFVQVSGSSDYYFTLE